ncbi:unnamed protein product [Menidia menidia]|uniref:(Atlantic silverside) hypothetical protein n=1 Tax=Menidia menidia TaxID=238744 RepID=A0A8S4AS49_9TELE|nr:unnamed protein product [Menidia menidia]
MVTSVLPYTAETAGNRQQVIVDQVPAPALVIAAQQGHIALALHCCPLCGDPYHRHRAEGAFPPDLPGVAQDVRPQCLVAQSPASQAAPHLAVLVRQDVIPVPADQRTLDQVGQLEIGEDVLQDAGRQPPGHPGASPGSRGVRRAGGGAATGGRCCT